MKVIIAIIIAATIFGSSHSASFECTYVTSTVYGDLKGTIYYCVAIKSVNTTSIETVQVDGISGSHLAGYTNDDVTAFYTLSLQIYYFPSNLDKFFKNLIAIDITNSGLKEIHTNELKAFPKLVHLNLNFNNLEILEENLFEFNPNLETIYLNSNKISHIDSNIFDKLTKLKKFTLGLNKCINMNAYNRTAVQNIIKAAKTQCTNSDYLDLKQRIKELEIESQCTNSKYSKEKLKILECEAKRSKFSNTFQSTLQSIKLVQAEHQKEAFTDNNEIELFSVLLSKVDNITSTLKELLIQSSKGTYCKDQTIQNQNEASREDLKAQNESLETKLEVLEENVENTRIAAIRGIEKLRIEVKTDHAGILASLKLRTDKIEKIIQKVDEQNHKIKEQMAKIMKALIISD